MAWNTPTTDTSPKPQKPTIMVLLPHRGQWNPEWVEYTWKPLCTPVDWCQKDFGLCRVPSLPLARNTLAQQLLDSKAEYGLWIDFDHIVEQPVVKVGENPDKTPIEMGDVNLALLHMYRALVESGESIVTALYRAKQMHGFNYAIWREVVTPEGKTAFEHIQNWEPPTANFFTVDVAGMGMMLMHRRILEKMRDLGYGSKTKPFFNWEHPESMSEDFDFLTKARKECGFNTWCLSSVKLSHIGELVITSEGRVRVPRI